MYISLVSTVTSIRHRTPSYLDESIYQTVDVQGRHHLVLPTRQHSLSHQLDNQSWTTGHFHRRGTICQYLSILCPHSASDYLLSKAEDSVVWNLRDHAPSRLISLRCHLDINILDVLSLCVNCSHLFVYICQSRERAVIASH